MSNSARGPKLVGVNLAREMAIHDSLPPELRRALDYSSRSYPPSQVAAVAERLGVAGALEWMRDVERGLRRAYRASLPEKRIAA